MGNKRPGSDWKKTSNHRGVHRQTSEPRVLLSKEKRRDQVQPKGGRVLRGGEGLLGGVEPVCLLRGYLRRKKNKGYRH